VGCPEIVPIGYGGYCLRHAHIKKTMTKDVFRELDKKKTPEQKRFYSSSLWTSTSKNHLREEPLCRQCKQNGKVKIATITHHNPPLSEILENGGNPYAEENLESICHQKELYKKRNLLK
jgi:hypothetical protein